MNNEHVMSFYLTIFFLIKQDNQRLQISARDANHLKKIMIGMGIRILDPHSNPDPGSA